MAQTDFAELISDFKKDLELAFQREADLHLAPLRVQVWVRELESENKRLLEETIKLHKELGSTAFNPVHI